MGRQLGRRAARTPDQFATAVGAAQLQVVLAAIGTEGALEGADIGKSCIGRQILVTAFTVGSKFKHGG